MAATRIRNEYLLSQLSILVGLGGQEISCTVFVEAWSAKGRSANDEFFLHFDTLEIYGFIDLDNREEQLVKFDELVQQPGSLDTTISVTHAGSEFLSRYG